MMIRGNNFVFKHTVVPKVVAVVVPKKNVLLHCDTKVFVAKVMVRRNH